MEVRDQRGMSKSGGAMVIGNAERASEYNGNMQQGPLDRRV